MGLQTPRLSVLTVLDASYRRVMLLRASRYEYGRYCPWLVAPDRDKRLGHRLGDRPGDGLGDGRRDGLCHGVGEGHSGRGWCCMLVCLRDGG